MVKILILMTCFYHYEFIERTLESIVNSTGDPELSYDIYFLENPSQHSDRIAELGRKYHVARHYLCNKNIAGQINVCFLKQTQISDFNEYDYIAMTESDVVLDQGAIQEAIDLLNQSRDLAKPSVEHCSVALYTNLPKYKSIKKKKISLNIDFSLFIFLKTKEFFG